MICSRCSSLLPHDLVHVRDHAAVCTGNSVEEFLAKFSGLSESITAMATAGRMLVPACLHEPDEDPISGVATAIGRLPEIPSR